MNSTRRIAGLLISAGFSRRMGDFKPLMPFRGLPLVVGILLKMNSVCDTIGVVIGFRGKELQAEISRYLCQLDLIPEEYFDHSSESTVKDLVEKVVFIPNPDYEKGMFTSLQCGIRELSATDWLLYHFVDQPNLPFSFYRAFVQQVDDVHNWIQPCFGSRCGHPILLHQSLFRFILNEPPGGNLRVISRSASVRKKLWDCPFPQILQDLDTPEDFRRWTDSE